MRKLWGAGAALFKGIFRLLALLRQALVALLTLTVVLALFGAFNPERQPFPTAAVLELTPSGALVDQLSYRDPFSELLDPDGAPPETLLRELIQIVEAAATDPAIAAMVLSTDQIDRKSVV